MKKWFFKLDVFVIMIAVCAIIAAVTVWITGLNFWVLGAILVIAVLINGFIASIEDGDSSQK